MVQILLISRSLQFVVGMQHWRYGHNFMIRHIGNDPRKRSNQFGDRLAVGKCDDGPAVGTMSFQARIES